MYRHITLDNILINYNDENDREKKNIMKGTIKIIDFGFARYLKKGELTKSILGSPINMSPIILYRLNKIPEYKNVEYDEKEDVWSLGAICYELLMGRSTFNATNMKELESKINKGDYYISTRLSKETVSFIKCMLQYESKKRPSFDELSNHVFLKKNVKDFNKIEFDELKNEVIKGNSYILLNTKSNETLKLIMETEFKKYFDE